MRRSKKALLVLLAAVVMAGCIAPVMAATEIRKEQVEVGYRDIEITIDGNVVVPTNVHGDEVEPFLIDGTTYIPIRGLSELLGYNVDWVDEDSQVIVTSLFEITGNEYYEMGYTYKQAGDYELAAKCFLMCDILGDGEGVNQLAELVYGGRVDYGEGADQTEKAFYWWEKSLEYGYPRANYSIGMIYAGAENIPGAGSNLGTIEADDDIAFEYFMTGAEDGDNKSARMVGQFYEEGRSVEQDIEKAMEYYALSADRLDSTGAIKYADYLVETGGDIETATQLYTELATPDHERAIAAGGHDIAAANLGLAKLAEADGDMETAIAYYVTAADANNAEAQEWVEAYGQDLYDTGYAQYQVDGSGLDLLFQAAELGNEDALAFFGK